MKIQLTFFATFLIIMTSVYGQPLKDTIVDFDGNVYHTVKIGSQVWMVENLKATHYRNGDLIPEVTSDTDWYELTSGAYCNYSNDTSYAEIYGRLYNRYAVVDSRYLCPLGWHVASVFEWRTLIRFIDYENFVGGNPRETDTIYWEYPTSYAKSESGFKALLTGCRGSNKTFQDMGNIGYWWSSSEYSGSDYYSTGLGDAWQISKTEDNFETYGYYDDRGFSVRCIKDSIEKEKEK
jgi:uncharacterized protein (TIGR02145 family)